MRSLQSITIPDSVTSIQGMSLLFNSCASLQTVTLGTVVTIISTFMFNGCNALHTVVMSESVTTIYGSAFNNCNSL